MTYHPYSEVENSRTTGSLDGVTIVVIGEPEDMREHQRETLVRLTERGARIVIGMDTHSRLGSALALAALANVGAATTLDVAMQAIPIRRMSNDPPPFALARDPGKKKAQWKRETYGKPRR